MKHKYRNKSYILVITDVPRKGNVGAYSDTPQNPIPLRTTDTSVVSSTGAYINTPLHQNGDIYAADVFPYPSIGSYDNETRRDIPKGVLRSPSKTVGAIIRGFKSVSTKRINQLRGLCVKSVWQRNYYEHIIRNERELNHIRQYIIDNPKNWEHDENYFIS